MFSRVGKVVFVSSCVCVLGIGTDISLNMNLVLKRLKHRSNKTSGQWRSQVGGGGRALPPSSDLNKCNST